MVEIIVPQAKEKWYQSRRIWAAILTAVATAAVVALPEQYELITAVGSVIAMGLGIRSWTVPKK